MVPDRREYSAFTHLLFTHANNMVSDNKLTALVAFDCGIAAIIVIAKHPNEQSLLSTPLMIAVSGQFSSTEYR